MREGELGLQILEGSEDACLHNFSGGNVLVPKVSFLSDWRRPRSREVVCDS